jgi:hypothetical protein
MSDNGLTKITELNLWNLSYIWMKILNAITCKLNGIELKFNSNWISKHWMESNSIQNLIRLKIIELKIIECKLVHKVLKICLSLSSFVTMD